MIEDREARHALRTVQMCSRYQWRVEGSALDLAEYEDAALDALVACLERYDTTRGVAFSVYAAPRMRGAVRGPGCATGLGTHSGALAAGSTPHHGRRCAG